MKERSLRALLTETPVEVIDTSAFPGGWIVMSTIAGHGFEAGAAIGRVYRIDDRFDAIVDGPTIGAATFYSLEDALDYFAGFIVARASDS